jgi:hypothetical protein
MAARRAARPRSFVLPLFDALRDPYRPRRRYVAPHKAPRILFPGVIEPFRLPAPPTDHDPIDATRLGQRLAALAAALDDLPGHARRFARWRAFRDAAVAQERASYVDLPSTPADGAAPPRQGEGSPARLRRVWPLRSGRPPGGRTVRYDPAAPRPSHIHEIDDILANCHDLARDALEHPDSS